MKERRNERFTATGRCDVQFTVAMEEDLDAIADVLDPNDVGGEADARMLRTLRFELSMKA